MGVAGEMRTESVPEHHSLQKMPGLLVGVGHHVQCLEINSVELIIPSNIKTFLYTIKMIHKR